MRIPRRDTCTQISASAGFGDGRPGVVVTAVAATDAGRREASVARLSDDLRGLASCPYFLSWPGPPRWSVSVDGEDGTGSAIPACCYDYGQ